MALSDFPAHFAESVAILLELTEKQGCKSIDILATSPNLSMS